VSSQYGANQDIVEELKKIIYSDDSAEVEAATQPLQQMKVEKFAGIAQRLLRERYTLQSSNTLVPHRTVCMLLGAAVAAANAAFANGAVARPLCAHRLQ
jgi:hypothetical protein